MSDPTYNGRTRAQIVALVGENGADNYISFRVPDTAIAQSDQLPGPHVAGLECDEGATGVIVEALRAALAEALEHWEVTEDGHSARIAALRAKFLGGK